MSSDDAGNGVDESVSGGMVRHGPGVTANRAFPTNNYPSHLDPFVLFERFDIDPEQGFPMHPHRGFEIVTYMLDGGMDHEDSLGVEHTAYENEAMHIVTGGGIEHSEFAADGEACNGLQLWVNLPREQKDADPSYADADSGALPTDELDGATVTTIVGTDSPLDPVTRMEYLDVRVTESWTWSFPDEWAGFLYGVAGEGTVGGSRFAEGDVLPVTGSRDVELRSDESLRVIAVSGRPHGDPIQQQGPFVF